MTMHPGQLAVSGPVVRALVDSQFPRWRDLPVWYYVDTNPAMSRMGRVTLGRILAAERAR